ncbi:MAG: hypothetical protein DRP56_00720, partial [Planctomycetota bacterium]
KPGMDTKRVIARFEAERQALALLNHPNIAKVFDAGSTDEGRPYFVMEYVEGVSITDYCDQHQLSIKERLELFIKVCEALHHAHQKGIIHRDIKPSNVLVSEEDGHAVPKVIDFGIAKAISQHLTEETIFTEQGQLVGTPEYMSPEQADLGNQDIDTLTDVYSLGVLLYELLTGALPFDPQTLRKAAFREIQRIICEQEPPRPSTRISLHVEDSKTIADNRQTAIRTLQRQLHNELEWIPLMAMRKERDRRYQSAADLAEDMQRYLTGEALLAGPDSDIYKIKKFTKRHRRQLISVASFLIISVSIVFAVLQSGKIRRQDEINNKILYANTIKQAANEYYENFNRERARELLKSCSVEQRGWEWYYLDRVFSYEDDSQGSGNKRYVDFWVEDGWKRFSQIKMPTGCRKVLFSPDGKLFALENSDGLIEAGNIETGEIVFTVGEQESSCELLAFSPDGRLLTSQPSAKNTLKLIDIRTGIETIIKSNQQAKLTFKTFSPNGKYIACITGSSDDLIKIWNTKTGKEILSAAVKENFNFSSGSVVFSPNEKLIAYHGFGEKEIKILNIPTGSKYVSFQVGPFIKSVRFSPDGKYIAAKDTTNIKIWNTETMSEVFARGDAWGDSFDFSPDGKRIAYKAHGLNQGIKVIDLGTQREVISVPYRHHNYSIAFAQNGENILMTGRGKIEAWSIKTGRKVFSVNLSVDGKNVRDMAVSSDTKMVATKSLNENSFILWELEDTPQVEEDNFKLSKHLETARIITISPNGDFVAFGSVDNAIKILDAKNGEIKAFIRGDQRTVKLLKFSPDSKSLAYAGSDEILHLWNIEKKAEAFSFQGHEGELQALAFSPDGRQIALSKKWTEWTPHQGGKGRSGKGRKGVELLDIISGKSSLIEDFGGGTLAYSPDGEYIASGDTAYFFETKERLPLPKTGGKCRIFSPGGKLLATVDRNGNNIILSKWDTKDFITLSGHWVTVNTLAFNSDGSRLFSGSDDNTIKVWDTTTGLELLTLKGHHDNIENLIYNSNSEKIVSFSNDAEIKIWRSAILKSPNTVSMEELYELVNRIESNIRTSERFAENSDPKNEETAKKARKAIKEGRNKFNSIINKKPSLMTVKDTSGQTLLHKVAQRGQDELVKSLLNKSAIVDVNDNSEKTALHLAVARGHLSTVKIIADYEANVDAIDNSGQAILVTAAKGGHTDIVKCLISKGANVNTLDNLGKSILAILVEKGLIEGVAFLIEHDAAISKDTELRKALYLLAAREGNNTLVKLIIKDGIDIETKNEEGETSLHLAIGSGHSTTAELLIDGGVAVNTKSNTGITPLHCAAGSGNKKLVQMLIAKGAEINVKDKKGSTPLHNSLYPTTDKKFDGEIAKMLINKGADINVKDDKGHTPLRYAVLHATMHGSNDMIEYLISKGGNIHSLNKYGKSPLDMARDSRKKEIAELLIKIVGKCGDLNHSEEAIYNAAAKNNLPKLTSLLSIKGVKANFKDNNGNTPLHVAIASGYKDIVQVLINKGAKVSLKNNEGDTPLHIASTLGYKDIVQLLINKEAEVSVRNSSGNTPLHIASMHGYKDIAELLINKEANTNLKNNDGDIPLHIASMQGHKDIVESLINNKSEVNIRNNNGYTPLYLALINDHLDIIMSLQKPGTVVGIDVIDTLVNGDLQKFNSIIKEKPELLDDCSINSQPLLHIVAKLNQVKAVEVLLGMGIDMNFTNDKGYTALDAITSSQKEVLLFLQEHGGERFVSIHKAALLGDLKTVKQIINENKDAINSEDVEGMTPLHWAALMGHKNVVKYLVVNGAVLKNGQQFAQQIKEHGYKDISELLYKCSRPCSLGEFDKAVLAEDIEMLKEILEEHPEEIEGRSGVSAIHNAARSGNIQIAEFLIKHGVHVNSSTRGLSDEVSPLYLSIAYGHPKMADLLIQNGGTIDTEDSLRNYSGNWHTELFNNLISAVVNDNKVEIESVLSQFSSPKRRELGRYRTSKGLLFYAAQKGKLGSVEALIENGLSPNIKLEDPHTHCLPLSNLLYWAVKNGNEQIAQFLIDNGAEVNPTTCHPLSCAAIYNQPQMALLLIEKGADVNGNNRYSAEYPLYLAVENRNIQVAKLLIANGAEINAQTRNGVSPLYQAAKNGDVTMARLLIENGADVNIKNKEDETALHIASRRGKKEVAELLINHGADINAKMRWQRGRYASHSHRHWTIENITLTSLDIAAQWNYPCIVKMLIDNGATRHFAMQRATEREHEDMLKLLVEADPNNKSDIDECLLLAIRLNRPDMVACLVDLGAEIDGKAKIPENQKFHMKEIKPGFVEVSARPRSGGNVFETPLHSAAQLGCLEIVKYLVEKGANPNVLNFLYETPLDVAVMNGHTETADFLKDRTDPATPKRVGRFGAKELLVFQGNGTFTKEQICKQLFMDTDIIVALSPKASFPHYLDTLQKKIVSGYRNNGFYEPQVSVSFENEQQKILVEIREGSRYRKGRIVIDGIDDSSRNKLIEMLRSENLANALMNVSIAEMDILKGTFKFPFTWNETDWACFEESFIEPSKQYVDQLLNLIGCYNSEFDLKVIPAHKGHSADLHITFTKEGTLAKIGTLDISGNTINADEQVIAFLGLEKGLSLNSLLINRIQNKLRESGRFRQHTVDFDINEKDPANSTLKIVLQEIPGATPLGKKSTEEEELLEKVGQFFADYENWEEDLCFTISTESNKYYLYELEGIMSPRKGLILTEMDDGKMVNSLAIQPGRIHYFCPLLGHHVSFKPNGQIVLQLTISPDDNKGEGGWYIMLGGGFAGRNKRSVESELSYDIQINIPPVFWMSEANKSDTKITYVDNTAVIELRGTKNSLTIIKADRETGRIIEIDRKGESGLGTIRFEKGAFERQIEKVQQKINAAGLEPIETKSIKEAILLSAVPLYLTHSPNDILSMEQKCTSVKVWNQILTSGIINCFPENKLVETDDEFSLPHYDSMSSMNKMVSLFTGTAFGWCHENLPQDHWLRTLTHVIALAVSGHGQNETVLQEMQTLYTSDQIGPAGYYLIAKVFQQMGHPAYRSFVQRAQQTLTVDGFRKDWKPLVSGDFKLAKNIRCSFDKLQACESEDLHLAASILPGKAGVNFETTINRLKESKEMSLAKALEDLLADEWPIIKKYIENYLSEIHSASGNVSLQ